MLRIDVYSSRELQALILSVRRATKEMQAQIRRHTKAVVAPEWRKALAQEATTRQDHRVLVDTARVTVSNQNIKLRSGGLARKVSGGARAWEISAQVEFGAARKQTSYEGRRGATRFPTTRTTTAQFKPRNRKGYTVYPAAAGIIPRIAALWTQTAVRTLYEAFERKL